MLVENGHANNHPSSNTETLLARLDDLSEMSYALRQQLERYDIMYGDSGNVIRIWNPRTGEEVPDGIRMINTLNQIERERRRLIDRL